MRPHPDRRIEWWLALQTLAFGLFLMLPAASMDAIAFMQLRLWMPEMWWGVAFAATGALHCMALFINGRRWWTPYVRAAMTISNLLAYTFLLAGFWLLDPHTTAVATYGGLCVAACICLYGAIKDSVHAGGTHAVRR